VTTWCSLDQLLTQTLHALLPVQNCLVIRLCYLTVQLQSWFMAVSRCLDKGLCGQCCGKIFHSWVTWVTAGRDRVDVWWVWLAAFRSQECWLGHIGVAFQFPFQHKNLSASQIVYDMSCKGFKDVVNCIWRMLSLTCIFQSRVLAVWWCCYHIFSWTWKMDCKHERHTRSELSHMAGAVMTAL